MELFERYVHQVGKRLPRQLRADVAAELRSLLADTLEERRSEDQEASHEALVVDILKEFGSPDAMAASYLPPRQYLIGPAFFTIFKIVIFAEGVALTVAFTIIAGFSLWGVADPGEIARILAGILGSFVQAALAGLGMTTLVMAAVERLVNPDSVAPDEEEWNPRDLPEIEASDDLKMGELIFGLCFTIAALVLFNVFPQYVGLASYYNEAWHFLPLLTEGFDRLLPWLNAYWLGQVILCVLLLRRGRWEVVTRAVDLGLTILGIVPLALMITGEPWFGLDAAAMSQDPLWGLTFFYNETVISTLWTLVRLALIIGLAATLFNVLGKLWRFVRRQ